MGTTHSIWPNNTAIFNDYTPQHNKKMRQMIINYEDVIIAGLFGHEHAEDYKLVLDDLGVY